MILSDVTIEKYIDSGKIRILPKFEKYNIRPTGIRLHLGNEILVPDENQTVDLGMLSDIKYRRISISEKGYLFKRGMFFYVTVCLFFLARANANGTNVRSSL